jgi:hypothetical protein
MSEYQSSQSDWAPETDTETVWVEPEVHVAPPPQVSAPGDQPLRPSPQATWSAPPSPPASSAAWSPPPADRWAPPPQVPPAGPRPRFPLTPAALVALGAVLAGAVAELSFYSYQEVDGIQTDCTYVNVAPLLFGPVAAIAGLIALVRSGRPGRHRTPERIAGLLAVVVGVIHVLGGLDLIGGVTLTLAGNGPC